MKQIHNEKVSRIIAAVVWVPVIGLVSSDVVLAKNSTASLLTHAVWHGLWIGILLKQLV